MQLYMQKKIDIWLRPRIGSGYVYTYVSSKLFSYLYLDNAALIPGNSHKYDWRFHLGTFYTGLKGGQVTRAIHIYAYKIWIVTKLI